MVLKCSNMACQTGAAADRTLAPHLCIACQHRRVAAVHEEAEVIRDVLCFLTIRFRMSWIRFCHLKLHCEFK